MPIRKVIVLLLSCSMSLTGCAAVQRVLAPVPTLPEDPPASALQCQGEPPIPPRAILEQDGALAAQTTADITLAGRDCRRAVGILAKWWERVKALYAPKQ